MTDTAQHVTEVTMNQSPAQPVIDLHGATASLGPAPCCAAST